MLDLGKKDSEGLAVRSHARRRRNINEDYLQEILSKNRLTATNTFFKQSYNHI